MKALVFSSIFTLLASGALAKGGDFPIIPDNRIGDRLLAYSQVKVSIGFERNHHAYKRAVYQFIRFLEAEKKTALLSQYKVKKSPKGHAVAFCVSVKSVTQKPLAVKKIGAELSRHHRAQVKVGMDSKLIKPCT